MITLEDLCRTLTNRPFNAREKKAIKTLSDQDRKKLERHAHLVMAAALAERASH